MEMAPLALRKAEEHYREVPYNNIRADRSCLPEGVQNHTLGTKNAYSVVAVTKNYRTL